MVKGEMILKIKRQLSTVNVYVLTLLWNLVLLLLNRLIFDKVKAYKNGANFSGPCTLHVHDR